MRSWVFVICTFVFLSCSKEKQDDCFHGTGPITPETRFVEPFSGIEVYDKIEYELVKDTVEKIEIIAGKNLLEQIKVRYKEGRLVISNENTCNFIRSFKIPIRVIIHYKNIHHLIYSGAAGLFSRDTIRRYDFRIDSWSGAGKVDLIFDAYFVETYLHTGSADFQARGFCNLNYVYSNGTNFIYYDKLNCDAAFVNHTGTGNFFLNVNRDLEVAINGQGDVYYRGDPRIKRTGNGTGKLIQQ